VTISILLPARNAAATLPIALESVRRQSLTGWECIVVDDGSTDQTAAIVQRAARQDGRFRPVSTPHQGLVGALATGLRHCRAPLIARMDADDVMHRERLAVQAAALDRDRALAAVGCHVRIFPRRRMSQRLREYEAWLNGMQSADDVARDAFVECPVAHPTLMMRRELAALGYVDRGWPEDYDLVLRALGADLRIGVVPRRLLAWRDRPEGESRTNARYTIERFTECKAHHLARGFLGATDRYVLWGYGGTGRCLRRALARYGKQPSHILEVKVSRIGQLIHGAPVVALDRLTSLRGQRIVVSVARGGPRAEIRETLQRHAFVDGRDYVCAA
jgi:glycosyltransferase involved in cell wall biosynthesis